MAKRRATGEQAIAELADELPETGEIEIRVKAEVSPSAPSTSPISILSEEIASKLSTYLKTEIENVESERSVRSQQWAEWARMRLSQPASATRSSPWPNASNVEVPMMQSKINTVYSKFNKAFSSKDPFWTASTDEPALKAGAAALTKYLTYYAKNPYGLDLSSKRRATLYDCITFGTQVVRVPWLRDVRPFKAPGLSGSDETRTMIVHDGPALVPVPIENFYIHPYWEDLQKAPWYAVKCRLTLAELRQREAEGIYENIEQVLANPVRELSANETESLARRGITPADLNAVDEFQLWDIYEVRLFWDFDGDGQLEDGKLWYEKESGVFLRSEYNPLPFRDDVPLRFLAIPGQFYGLGEGEILQYLQKEITSTHNRRADNQTLAMQQVWKANRASGMTEDTIIFPGKVIMVDDPNDIIPFQFPDLSGSAVQSEQMARAYADEASGAASPLAGIADPTMKSGAGAASTMFLAQQSGDMLSSIADNLTDDWGTIGLYVVMQMIANLDAAPASPLSTEEQAALTQILTIPIEELPTKLRLQVQTSDISQTKDAAKQNLLTVSQLYTAWGQQGSLLAQTIDQLTQGGQNPAGLMTPAGRMAASLMVGGTLMMQDILKYFGIEDSQDYVPSVADLRATMELIDAQIELSAQQLEQGGQGGSGAGIGPGAAPGAQALPMGSQVSAGGQPAVGLGGPQAPGAGFGAGPAATGPGVSGRG